MTYFGQFPDDPYYQTAEEEAVMIARDAEERTARAHEEIYEAVDKYLRGHNGITCAELGGILLEYSDVILQALAEREPNPMDEYRAILDDARNE